MLLGKEEDETGEAKAEERRARRGGRNERPPRRVVTAPLRPRSAAAMTNPVLCLTDGRESVAGHHGGGPGDGRAPPLTRAARWARDGASEAGARGGADVHACGRGAA
ncbi:hypothetical protein NL676_021915 [Syzygium grande]|nr:hypothetical protein NL676_021915 [Syzygium grande]